MELEGRTAIVTGAGGGIGRAIAAEFGRCGANVICCGRREATLRKTVGHVERDGGRAELHTVDVTDRGQVQRMADDVLERFGQIDALYNCAGSLRAIGPLWDLDPEAWWRDVTINLLGTMLCCRAALPDMLNRNEGVIINMSGGGADGPLPGGSAYGCSKAAVVRFTQSLARECERAAPGVFVFTMNPGFVRSDMTEPLIRDAEARQWFPWGKEAVDSGQDRKPEECARKSVELIRVACTKINGGSFDVDTDFSKILDPNTT